MDSCWWFWDLTEWIEHPQIPHYCSGGGFCVPPLVSGTYYGEEAQTYCDLA